MSQAKSSVTKRRRHKKVLERAKGMRGGRSKLIRPAKEAVQHALQYAYEGRKQRKRDYRSLWIIRISAGAKAYGISYSRFIAGLKKAGVVLDRKILAHLAFSEKDAFEQLTRIAKEA